MPLGMMYLLRGMNTLHCSISKHKKTNKSKLRAILPKKGEKNNNLVVFIKMSMSRNNTKTEKLFRLQETKET